MKRQFGRYVISDEVADELGRGGFARVYRAFDPNVNRHVAVKVLLSESSPDMLLRFRDECSTAGKLEHENIVKIYDFALHEGMPYLVMELLEGDTLENVIKSRMVFGRPIQVLDTVEIMFQVAKGLQYAHARNVIHRDIKPTNIMLLPNGIVKVLDFGIARVMDKDGVRRTRQGDIAGSLLYLAPEQFKGWDADRRTDIFSYSDVYYELLAGEHPFYAEDPGTVVYRITAHDPQPIRQILPECPAALEAMIQRLMSKDREIRPDKLEEVIFDTQPILQRLRQDRAATLVSAIPALMEAGELDQAQEAIRQVLELDPFNSVARQLRDQLLEEKRHKAIRTRTEALARDGEAHFAARRWNEAVQCFEDACALDKSDPSLRARLEELKLGIERVRRAARLLSEARVELQQGTLEAALQKSEQALNLDPQNQEAEPLSRAVREQIVRRRDAAALFSAEEHRSRGEYTEALAALDRIEAGSAARIDASNLRKRVERDRADAERRRRRELFEAALSDARGALVSGDFDAATASAEALCAEYPEESEAVDFLSEVREHLAAQKRMEAVGNITQAAHGLIRKERFADAHSVLEQGLQSYPGDTGLIRLLQVAGALAAAQERARQINRVVEQTQLLAADGRLDEAILAIDRAISEFGNEVVLAERKRNLEFERARAEYAAGLQKTLAEGQRLLTEDRPGEAMALLEEAKFRFPGDSDLAALLSSARVAREAAKERSFVSQTLSQIAAMEAVEQFGPAMALVEPALARYPANADLRLVANLLQQKLQEQEHRRMLAIRVGNIEAAIQSGDWERAEIECQDAVRLFPGDAALSLFPARVQDGRRQSEIQMLQVRVQASLKQQGLDEAERELAAVREIFSQEAVWQDLWRECQSLKQYRDNLALAETARARKDYALAEEILRPLRVGAPDKRAANLLGDVVGERRAAEEDARREEEDRRRREAVEARRDRERAAIARGRAEAANLARKAEYATAVALLDQLAGQYPAEAGIEQDREAARHEWERQRREAEEHARRQAISAGRQEAGELLHGGDFQGAIALLDRLAAEFPDAIEIRQDREAAVSERERQQRKAEEHARQQAISAARQEAGELLRGGDFQGAITLLDRLAAEFPDAIEIRQDREAALGERERQRREAEEQARRRREQAISTGRQKAAELLNRGDWQRASAILDSLGAEYPDSIEIRHDREAALHEGERQRHEAEEQARQQAISAGRQEAAELTRRGDWQAAFAVLDRLGAEYPGAIEIREDREAALREKERLRREAEEQTRQQAISAGHQEAAELTRRGDWQAAIAILDRLGAEYPDAIEIREDREAALREEERLRREGEEQVRRRRELAVSAGHQEAADLLRRGDWQAAIAVLDHLGADYPDALEIHQDREAAVHEGERQRREAEEQARQQAISAGRQEATNLLNSGNSQAAVALLDRLGAQYPDNPEIRQDLAAAQREVERQRREAEEQARQQAISAGRQEATNLLNSGDSQAAVALLDRLGAQYPDNPEIRQDREAAQREVERQRREAEEQARRQREQAISTGRQKAAELLQNGDLQGALAILHRLGAAYPDATEIRQDRDTAWREWGRQRREAEEEAQRRRQQVIAAGRQEAAELLRNGDARGAIAALDRLGAAYPGAIEIGQDREAARHEWEQQQREAEEQVRRERELAAIAQGRDEAAGLMRIEDYHAAGALLDRLALQFPGNPDIEQDRKAAAEAINLRHLEAEERARRALAVVSARRREPGEFANQRHGDASTGDADAAAVSMQEDHQSEDNRLRDRRPEAEQRAREALDAFSTRVRTGAGRGNAEAGNEAPPVARAAGGEAAGYGTSSFTSYRSSPDGGSAPEPAPEATLGRLYGFIGRAILNARNAMARVLGRG
jgi:serine/threonine protein kinase